MRSQTACNSGAAKRRRKVRLCFQEPLDLTQSGLSYHMKILCDSGIVTSRQEGKWTHYQLSDSGREYAIELLKELTTPDTEQAIACHRCG